MSSKSTSTALDGKSSATLADKKVVNYLFKKLIVIFPAWSYSIKSQEDLNIYKAEWYLALVQNDINSFEQIEDGLKKARQYAQPYFPSCGMFIQWCNEGTLERYNVPDAYECFKKLATYDSDSKIRLDKFSYWIWRNMDTTRFKTIKAADAQKYLGAVHKQMIKKFLGGEVFLDQPALISKAATAKPWTPELERQSDENIKKIKKEVSQ